MNYPVFTLTLVAIHCAGREIDSHAAVERIVIHEVAFDDVAFVAERDKEFFETIMSVVLHYVPKDRVSAHLDHWLWFNFSFFCQPRAEAAGKNHYLHLLCPSVKSWLTAYIASKNAVCTRAGRR